MIRCTACLAPLRREIFNTPGLTSCPSCSVLIRADVFPALTREQPAGTSGESLVIDDDSGCFFHPDKKAVTSCAVCGRFLCSLCDVEFDGRHLCVSCIETGKKKHKIKNLENHRILYDTIVLALAIIPMLFVWPSILTAPAALFMAIYYWNAPTSIIPRTKIRLVAAIILAGLQIVAWSVFFYYIATR